MAKTAKKSKKLPEKGDFAKIAKKWQKRPKNSKKMAKMGYFAQQNVPLRDDFFRLFSRPFSWLVQKVRFGPPNFNRGFRLHGDMTETKSPISQFSSKISIFSPIKI